MVKNERQLYTNIISIKGAPTVQETVSNAIFNCSDGICHHLRNARDIHLL